MASCFYNIHQTIETVNCSIIPNVVISHRLVRGDGEILEEIVSETRHKEINRTATKGDGASFQATLTAKMKM